MLHVTDIIDRVRAYQPAADAELIKRAYDYSSKAHTGQTRKSGDPYFIHPASVAGIITSASEGRPDAAGIQREEAGRYYNSIRVLQDDGIERARYDKAHLVPFGEYIPFGDLAYDWFGLRAFAAQAGSTYSAGPGPQVLDLGA